MIKEAKKSVFYRKLEVLCAQKGVSVSKMAEDLGLSNSAATHWKKSPPKGGTVYCIAEYLGTTSDYLLNFNDAPPTAAADPVPTDVIMLLQSDLEAKDERIALLEKTITVKDGIMAAQSSTAEKQSDTIITLQKTIDSQSNEIADLRSVIVELDITTNTQKRLIDSFMRHSEPIKRGVARTEELISSFRSKGMPLEELIPVVVSDIRSRKWVSEISSILGICGACRKPIPPNLAEEFLLSDLVIDKIIEAYPGEKHRKIIDNFLIDESRKARELALKYGLPFYNEETTPAGASESKSEHGGYMGDKSPQPAIPPAPLKPAKKKASGAGSKSGEGVDR